jgi:hypothetical protein
MPLIKIIIGTVESFSINLRYAPTQLFKTPLVERTDGRGCLVGPVTAAVILPAYFENIILNDGKQLSEKHERNYVL